MPSILQKLSSIGCWIGNCDGRGSCGLGREVRHRLEMFEYGFYVESCDRCVAMAGCAQGDRFGYA